MNREFMSEYFDRRYEDLMAIRDENASQKTAEAEKELMARCGGMDTALWEAYEKCMDARAAEYDFLLREVYLAGAEDREQMIK